LNSNRCCSLFSVAFCFFGFDSMSKKLRTSLSHPLLSGDSQLKRLKHIKNKRLYSLLLSNKSVQYRLNFSLKIRKRCQSNKNCKRVQHRLI
jgi:hypothetical protein